MARAPNERVNEAYKLYKKGLKLVEIAMELNISAGTIRSWKNRYKWDGESNATLQKEKCNVANKKGGQPGNKNATGPPGNNHAEKHGFFSKWLPEETMQIIGAIQSANPLDLLWDNIQLQYAAIVRAQKIMHVTKKEEMIKELKKRTRGDTSDTDEYEFEFAWDRQATFLQAQSRAMKTLEGMIKQYEELLKSDLATEEQKARIAVLKAKTNIDDPGQGEDDGFIDALMGKVDEIWQEDS